MKTKNICININKINIQDEIKLIKNGTGANDDYSGTEGVVINKKSSTIVIKVTKNVHPSCGASELTFNISDYAWGFIKINNEWDETTN